MPKIEMPAAASGAASDATMPVNAKSSVPTTASARNPRSTSVCVRRNRVVAADDREFARRAHDGQKIAPGNPGRNRRVGGKPGERERFVEHVQFHRASLDERGAGDAREPFAEGVDRRDPAQPQPAFERRAEDAARESPRRRARRRADSAAASESVPARQLDAGVERAVGFDERQARMRAAPRVRPRAARGTTRLVRRARRAR